MNFLFWGRRRREDDLKMEIECHLQMARTDRAERGERSEEARHTVHREFGNVDLVREVTRHQWGGSWLENLFRDLRFGARMLRKNPTFTAVAVLTLTLAIGANTAIFSVVNSVLLKPLPLRAANRIVVIWVSNLQQGWSRVGPSGLDYLDWKEQNKSFEDLFLFEHGTGTVTGKGDPEQVAGLRVTTNFADFFGLQPVLGRSFRPDESVARHNLVLLSYAYWQRRFGSDPAVIGRGMTLNGEGYTIIGVLPASLVALRPVDIVVPFDTDWVRRADSDLGVLGRLKPGVTLKQASAEMSAIAERIGRERPNRKGWGTVLVPLEVARVEYIRPALLLLLGAVVFVLLIACVNIANLMSARTVARQREVAIRKALGAGRAQLVRQFLAESTLLALVGGAAGLLLALWSTELLMKVVPSRIPVPHAADSVLLPKVHMDGTVVVFTLLASVFTGIIFGLVPALQSSRWSLNETLKEGGRGTLAGPRGHRTHTTLVIVEAALAFVLVIGAGLMINSFWRLLRANPGFNPEQLLTVRIKLSMDAKDSKYREPRQRAVTFQRFLENVEALPAVHSAALTEIVPLSEQDQDRWFFVIKEAPPPPPGEQFAADFRDVSTGYFGTMGIPLLRGRAFTDRDNMDGPRVVVIDETLARHFFPNQDPIGRHLQIPDGTRPAREIVGIVGAVRDTGFDQEPRPTIYFPYLQSPDQTMSMVVRTNSQPGAILPAIKSAIWSVDKNQPIFDVKTMDDIVSGVISAQRLGFVLLGIFALVALTLAAVGIYGVTSYAVSQRIQEIGIRMALGAGKYDVLKLIVGRGLALTLAGVAVGAGSALVLTRFLSSILYAVHPTDPLTYLLVTIVLGVVALLACYLPARRATRVDPVVALRDE